jgi:hypothetical protein
MKAVGSRVRCKKCGGIFSIMDEQPIDDDTICGWITSDDPSSGSVMGSTGIFSDASLDANGNGQRQAGRLRVVRLRKINSQGAYFEFPAKALMESQLRNSFSRSCVVCGTDEDLRVHLIHWPERLVTENGAGWNERTDRAVGKLAEYSHFDDQHLLMQLPKTRHNIQPFNLPFPVFCCACCRPSSGIETHVFNRGSIPYCRLIIRSLDTAESFFRHNGGRESEAYHHLIEERDRRKDEWLKLDASVRARISKWYMPKADEHFIRYFRDCEYANLEMGKAGLLLTDQRLVLKKYTACYDYPLDEDGRLEFVWRGDKATVHIYERGHPPAMFKLNRLVVDELTRYLQKVNCRWAVVS